MSGAQRIDLSCLARDLGVPLTAEALRSDLMPPLQRVVQCALDCAAQAEVKPDAIDALYLTGGSSALRPFQQALQQAFPGVPLVEGDLFGGVAAGLVYAAQ